MKAGMITLIAVALLAFLLVNNECMKTGYEINKLKAKKMELLNTGRILQIEASSLKSAERVEVIARTDLNLIVPDKYETITVQQGKEEGKGFFSSIKNGVEKTVGFIFSIF